MLLMCLVLAGGTSLAKANIQLNRMSEDVDIKIVPKPDNSDPVFSV